MQCMRTYVLKIIDYMFSSSYVCVWFFFLISSGAPAVNSSGLRPGLLLTTASKIEPMKALDSRFTERSKATPGVTGSPAGMGVSLLDR